MKFILLTLINVPSCKDGLWSQDLDHVLYPTPQPWPDPGGPGTSACPLAGMCSLPVSQVLPCVFKASSQEDVNFMKISVQYVLEIYYDC